MLDPTIEYKPTTYSRNLGKWAGGLLSIPFFIGLLAMIDLGSGITIFAYSIVGSLGISAAGFLISKWSRSHGQKLRDRRASTILEQARNGIVGKYSLYLRSFEITKKLEIRNPFTSFEGRSELEGESDDFEEMIARAGENFIPLVALGQPGEHIGIGRIKSTDESWQEDVKVLAKERWSSLSCPTTGLAQNGKSISSSARDTFINRYF